MINLPDWNPSPNSNNASVIRSQFLQYVLKEIEKEETTNEKLIKRILERYFSDSIWSVPSFWEVRNTDSDFKYLASLIVRDLENGTLNDHEVDPERIRRELAEAINL